MKRYLLSVFGLCLSPLIAGESAMDWSMFQPGIRKFTMSVKDSWMESPRATQDGRSFSRQEWRGSLTLQAFANESDEIQVGLHAGTDQIELNQALPKSGPVPENMQTGSVWTSWRHVEKNGLGYGLRVGYSGSGDDLESRDCQSARATAFVRLAGTDADDAWFLTLMYDERSQLAPGIPLPGIAYQWVEGKEWTAVLGLPFAMVRWKPQRSFELGALASPFAASAWTNISPVETVSAFRLYSSIEWSSDRWFRHNRTDTDDTITLSGIRAVAGPNLNYGMGLDLRAYAGWAFDQWIAEGDSASERRNNRVTLPDGLVWGASVQFAF